jgi:pimeloyl-ACP methyl ester carboxylesterase
VNFLEITVKNISVNYIDEGEGIPVIFLQGWGTNIDLYKKVTAKISTFSRIIALDLPGFGKTAEPSEAWNIDQYTDFVIDFISLPKYT